MSRPSTVVSEVRTAGADSQAGDFDSASAGTDYSQQDTPQLTLTDVVTNGTGTVTSLTGGFSAAMIGNFFNIAGTPYRITARASSTSITVDGSPSAASGQTGKVGGAYGTPGFVSGLLVNGNTVHIKTGTYTFTSGSSNVSGGVLSISARSNWIGYQAARNDKGTGPTFSAGALTSVTLVYFNTQHIHLDNITCDGNNKTSSRGFEAQALSGTLIRCKAVNCTNSGFRVVNNNQAILCWVTGCSTQPGFTGAGNFVHCVADSNTVTGFTVITAIGCIASNNSGASSDGFGYFGNWGQTNHCCTAVNNGRHGFAAGLGLFNSNCLAVSNGGYGFASTGSTNERNWNCAGYGNTSGLFQSVASTENCPTLTGNPLANPGGAISSLADAWTNFALNNTAGAGAACRAAGLVPYSDIGAVQHQDAGGGSLFGFTMEG